MTKFAQEEWYAFNYCNSDVLLMRIFVKHKNQLKLRCTNLIDSHVY